jgi:serine kinase of HPr protein (carbohydrate metabolism regulator)
MKSNKEDAYQNIHGTCVSIDGTGILITGRSGSGKSDLALRLIDEGATLVSDDQTNITTNASKKILFAAPPSNIAGKLEVRGIGIFKMPHEQYVPIKIIIDLDQASQIERLPTTIQTTNINGISIKTFKINPFEVSATTKVRLLTKKTPIDL